MTGRFAGKNAVVTGAASGIGLAIARRIVAEGGRVSAGDVNADGLDALAGELGDAILAVRSDVTIEQDVAGLVSSCAERYGAADGYLPLVPDGVRFGQAVGIRRRRRAGPDQPARCR